MGWFIRNAYKQRNLLLCGYAVLLVWYLGACWYRVVGFLMPPLPLIPPVFVPGLVYRDQSTIQWPYCLFYTLLVLTPIWIASNRVRNQYVQSFERASVALLQSLAVVSALCIPVGMTGIWDIIGYYPVPPGAFYLHGPIDPRYWVLPSCIFFCWALLFLRLQRERSHELDRWRMLASSVFLMSTAIAMVGMNLGTFRLQCHISWTYDIWWTRRLEYTAYLVGMALGSMAFFSSAGIFLVLLVRLPSINAARGRRCPQCDYDLRGSDGPTCPECGAVRSDAKVAML